MEQLNGLLKKLDVQMDIRTEGISPRLLIIIEGEVDQETGVGQWVEYQLETEENLKLAKILISTITEHKEEIIGWEPKLVEEDSPDLEEWQETMFEESWIPVDMNDEETYCDKITDIRMYLSLDGARLPIARKKAGKNNE